MGWNPASRSRYFRALATQPSPVLPAVRSRAVSCSWAYFHDTNIFFISADLANDPCFMVVVSVHNPIHIAYNELPSLNP